MEADYYTVYEAADVLGVSPARVRQMLRAGEIEGERGEQRAEGVLGPWRLPASAVHAAARPGANHAEEEATVAIPADAFAAPEGPAADTAGTTGGQAESPSETSERLSEGVRDLREKAEALVADLDTLEGRLEAAEVEQLAQKEALRLAEERSEGLRTRLEKERTRTGPQEQPRPAWRRWFGGG